MAEANTSTSVTRRGAAALFAAVVSALVAPVLAGPRRSDAPDDLLIRLADWIESLPDEEDPCVQLARRQLAHTLRS